MHNCEKPIFLKKIILFIIALITLNSAFSQVSVKGYVHSTLDNSYVTEKVYVKLLPNNIVKKAIKGHFEFNYLKPNTNYTLEVIAKHYMNTQFEIKTNEKDLNIDLDINQCGFNKQRAKVDWENGSAKLFLCQMCPENRNIDNLFEIKYNIEYIGQNCLLPEQSCIEEYNKEIIKMLNKEFRNEWHSKARYDIVGIDKETKDKLIENFKEWRLNGSKDE